MHDLYDHGPQGDAFEPNNASGDSIDLDPAKLEADKPKPTGHDPFDPKYLGLGQDFAAFSPVKPKWDIIKVEKPSKARVFRVHPTFALKTFLLTLKDENETYMVLPELRAALANESLCGIHALFPCVTKAGTPFLWPIRTADPDGKWNVWHESAFQIAQSAKVRWARMQSNRDAGHYVAGFDVRPPDQQQPPTWPDLPFSEWLRLAFQGYTIDSLTHPVLRRLRLED
ncbi:MAG TPA: hypothetical protein VHR66_29920 [Gemmataceae bacterium]|jgi:hypothetical protein|nr:hypothetical protein [Gemmataceae bacterium]